MKKIDSIQTLRAIAFLEIFMWHCHVPLSTGGLGVSIFIILSGYCMQMSYKRYPIEKCSFKENLLFAYKKIIKLYPLHILMLVYFLFLTKFRYTDGIILDTFLLQSLSTKREIWLSGNGVAWYLSTYMFICLIAPFILCGINRIKTSKKIWIIMVADFIILGLVGLIVSPLGKDLAQWITYTCPFYRIGDFSLGVCLARLLESNKAKNCPGGGYILLEILTIVLTISCMYLYNYFNILPGIKYTFLFIPASIMLVYLFVVNKGFFTKIFTNKAFVFLGNISSYAFLIHQMVIRTVMLRYNVAYESKFNICISFIGTIVLTILYMQLEKIIKKLMKKNIVRSK